MHPPLHPSQEGNLRPVLQTKLPSPEGPGVGSWAGRCTLCTAKTRLNCKTSISQSGFEDATFVRLHSALELSPNSEAETTVLVFGLGAARTTRRPSTNVVDCI